MTREWIIKARLSDDLPDGLSSHDRDDIEEVMESCCHFVTEQFLNLTLTYQIIAGRKMTGDAGVKWQTQE